MGDERWGVCRAGLCQPSRNGKPCPMINGFHRTCPDYIIFHLCLRFERRDLHLVEGVPDRVGRGGRVVGRAGHLFIAELIKCPLAPSVPSTALSSAERHVSRASRVGLLTMTMAVMTISITAQASASAAAAPALVSASASVCLPSCAAC